MKQRLSTPIVLLLFLGALSCAAYGQMVILGGLEMAEASDVAFEGRVLQVDKETATVTVEQVLHGVLAAKTVRVTPIALQECMGQMPNFAAGEKVIILGKLPAKNAAADVTVAITDDGEGKIKLAPETREAEIAAVKRLFAIAGMKTENDKNLAMLGEVRSKNPRLRREAHNFISMRLTSAQQKINYDKQLIELLRDDAPDVQQAALDGLRYAQAEAAIPRMIELSRGKDLNVINAASMALSRYDTAETAAALIELTRRQEPDIRQRACIDLSNSRRPEAKAALAAMLDDKDVTVRRIAPVGLVYLLRAGMADDLVPKLVALLKDPDEQVRARATDTLGETRSHEAIAPLIALLEENPASVEVRRQAISALYRHDSNGDRQAKAAIEAHLSLFIAALKNGKADESFGPAFQAMGILVLSPSPEAKVAVEWAAKSHPSAEIRGYAEKSLKRDRQ